MLSNAHSSLIRRAVLRWRLAPSSIPTPRRNNVEQSDAIAIAMSDAALDPATTHDSPWHREEEQAWEQTSSVSSADQAAIRPSFAETTRQAVMNSQLARPEPQDGPRIHMGSTRFQPIGGAEESIELPVQAMGLRFQRTISSGLRQHPGLDGPTASMTELTEPTWGQSISNAPANLRDYDTVTTLDAESSLASKVRTPTNRYSNVPIRKRHSKASTPKPLKIRQHLAGENRPSVAKSAGPSIISILTPVVPEINIAALRKENPTIRSHFTALRYLEKPTEIETTTVDNTPSSQIVNAPKDFRNKMMEQLSSWPVPAKATELEKAKLLNQIIGAGKGLVENDVSTRDLHMLSEHGTMAEREKSSRLLELRRTYDMHATSRFGIPPLAGDTEEKLDRMIDLWVYRLWLVSEHQSSDAKQNTTQRRLTVETKTSEETPEVEANDEETQAEVDSLLSLFSNDVADEPLDRVGGAQRMNTRVMERMAKDETRAAWKAYRRKEIQKSGGIGAKEDWKNALADSNDVDALYNQALPRASLQYEDHASPYGTKSYSIRHKPTREIAPPSSSE